MLYELAHTIQSKLPFVWNGVEGVNSILFSATYRGELKTIPSILESFTGEYTLSEVQEKDIFSLKEFFAAQPEQAFSYFKPHGFDEKSLRRLVRRKSQLMLVAKQDDRIVGYAFLRCFFNNKCFRGKIVDYRHRGKGIAVLLGKATTAISQSLGIRMFGTISKDNIASMVSSEASNTIKIVKELPNDYLYIEYLPKKE